MNHDSQLAELAEESQTPGNVGPIHISRLDTQAGGVSDDYNVISPRGRGGITISTGNGGSANGGSVIITGGNITNSAGSANGGNGGNASGGSVTIGDAGGPEDSAPPPQPASSPGRTPPANSESSSPPEVPTARPPPSSPPVSPTAHTPDSAGPTPVSSETTTFSETIQLSVQTGGASSEGDVSMASPIHHTTASIVPATAQQGGAARHAGPGPSRSLLLKILLPIFAVLLLAALATALVLRRRRRWRWLGEPPTAYVFPRESVVSGNSSRDSSKQRLLDAMAGKPGSSEATIHEPETSRASSSASGAPNTAGVREAMRHAGLPVSVAAMLQNAPQDQESEVPPSYHRG